ncbi:ROK family protein [Pontiella sulfatireligans]|uniref:N-acetylglucosamine kinase n=1 Tax=Pontiella sulfatireligans TaxID=2750658 RepID=A0A6C2UHY5_9BACT|nr:ROK family protein [Pontiella sulfatireligans]VGO18944.1 N-acetyl-D-glucosamine kinase [Pontiella sulfatireligans]
MNYEKDQRIVLTLDAGGTNFVFSAIQSNKEIIDPVRLPTETQELGKSLETIKNGFRKVMDKLDEKPVAISFAFPGPADYPNGIIDNVGNLPAFAGGVPLGPWLEKQFEMPVYINNDGDLFVYGEAIAGLLPKVNQMLEEAGSPKRYQTLFGVTLGTGFGGGMVHKGQLFIGDNSNATEVWLLRNKVRPECFIEDGASIRAVKNSYAKNAGIDPANAPSPKEIEDIALGKAEGDKAAAIEAYRELGEVVGEALSVVATLFDGLIVLGGGLSYGHKLFMPAVLEAMRGSIKKYDGSELDRIVQKTFNLEDAGQLVEFTKGETKQITVPGIGETLAYDPLKRIGIGISVLGTSEAVGIGAYAYALNQLDS